MLQYHLHQAENPAVTHAVCNRYAPSSPDWISTQYPKSIVLYHYTRTALDLTKNYKVVKGGGVVLSDQVANVFQKSIALFFIHL